MTKTPNSYKDPYWINLADQMGKKHGDQGLLKSILLHGEKSNANQVSSAGAKSPFQIIPATRDLAIKKWGIDPYLSDANAAEVAALLLKDDLKRTNGDIPETIASYHAGPSGKGRGPINKAYVARVTAGHEADQLDSLRAGFGDWLKNNPAIPTPKQEAKTDTDPFVQGFGQWLENGGDGKSLADKIPGAIPQAAPQPDPTLGDQIIGAGEAALNIGTGMVGGTVGMIGGAAQGLTQALLNGSFGTQQGMDLVENAAAEGANALTYQPRTQAGQDQAGAVGGFMQSALPATMLPETAAVGVIARNAAPLVRPIVAEAAQRAGTVARNAATGISESVRPAVNAARDMIGMEPIQPSSRGAPRTGSVGAAAVPTDTIRAQKAANLPVPIELTLGAESRDPMQLAFEKEQIKGPLGNPLRARAEENNLQALQNFDRLIDMTEAESPDFSSAGNKVVSALSDGLKKAKAETNVAYRKARNSPEAIEPVNPETPVSIGLGSDAINESLIGYLNNKVQGVPSAAVTDTARKLALKMGIAKEDANGNLVGNPATVGLMEDFRRELSGIAKWDDATGIRDETILKKIIDAQTEPVSGPLFKKARSLRVQQARKYENRAIVARLITNKKGMDDPKVAVDQVFHRSIINGSPEEITFLKRVLNTSGSDGKQAWKELQGAMIRHIKEEASKGMGMDSSDNPLISTAKLHQTVSALDKNGRLDIVLGKKNGAIVRDLNDVVRYVNTVPPGTLINNSGTTGALLAAIGEAGATGAITGLPVPVLSILRALVKHTKDNKMKAKINRALNARPQQSRNAF